MTYFCRQMQSSNVKITTDGNLEYIGRSDNQVKIRGFRVELEEIENHLRRNTLVTNAKVLYIDNHVRAYVSIVENARLTSQGIINQLNDDVRLLLPEHMRPTQYVLLSVIPTNSSGKIDLNTLKTMQPENISFNSKDVEYRCSTEMLIAKEFSSLLDITNIDRNDSFFAIGGNSMLAAKLAYKINHVLGVAIKVSDIYLHKNISNIATLIKFQGNAKDNLVKLNVSSGCEDLYMIHPGGVGCEVYQNLANALIDKFSCYGIDSYNMYSHSKITNVEQLAALYLSYIDAHCSNIKDDRVYNILGWSLGGYIALEMARQLEQRGVDNIRVILLDTVWMYANNSPLIDDEMLNNFESEVKYNQKKRFSAEGFDKYYINSRLDLTTAELNLGRSKLKTKLVNADILLFKAMLEDTRVKSSTIDLVNKYIASCKLNNIDDFVANTDQLKTIQVFAEHGSMLDDLQPLLNNIAEFLCSEEIYEA